MTQELMLQAAIDPEFREEFCDANLAVLPEAVEGLDEEFAGQIEEVFDPIAGATCNWGATWVCDAPRTCQSGFTIACENR